MSADPRMCSRCGTPASPGARYCERCGAELAPTPGAVPSGMPPGPSPPGGQWQTAAGAKQRIAEIVQRRGATDEVISEIWIILPIIALVGGWTIGLLILIGLGALPGILALVGASILAAVLVAILNYKLIKRQNEHMVREAALRRAIIDLLRAKGEERGVGYSIYPNIQTMEAIDRDAAYREQQHDAVVWTLLPFIPLVGFIFYFYMLWFLTGFTPDHDRRWNAFTGYASAAGNSMGIILTAPTWRVVKERSFILLLVLTILFSPVLIYWYWVLIKDGNEHLINEWQLEDQLMAQIERV